MKKLICSIFLITNICQAALSPLNQSIREIKDVLSSSYLAEHLGQAHPISEVILVDETDDTRVYTFATINQIVFAKLNYIKSTKMGPRSYTIEWDHTSK